MACRISRTTSCSFSTSATARLSGALSPFSRPARAGTSRRSASSRLLPKGSCLVSQSTTPSRPISTNPATGRPTDDDALAGALLLLDRLDGQLPLGLLVYDAKTLELMHANPPLLDFVDPDLTLDELESRNEEHDAQFRASELASALEEVAATGSSRHLP